MCVIRQRRLITGLKISYQRRYNIYVPYEVSGKEVRILYRPTYCMVDETNKTTDYSGRIGSKKKLSQDTGLISLIILCRKRRGFEDNWLSISLA